jgi:hypothetical protein
MQLIIILQLALPGRIHPLGSIHLRQLGEAILLWMAGNTAAPALRQEWQCVDGGAERGCGCQWPAVDIGEDDQHDEEDHQE